MTVETRLVNSTQTCSEFQELLPELAASGQDFRGLNHLETCEKCSELVRELEYIVQQAKLLLPLRDPSPKVWDNIQKKLTGA